MWFPLIGLVGKKEADEDSFEEVDEEFAEVDDEFAEVADEFAEVVDEPAEKGPPAPGPPARGGEPGSGDFKLVMSAPEMESQAPMERLDSVERAIDEAIRRMDMSDRSSEAITHDINTVKESIGRIEANMRELTSLYDLISSQVNPFIDVEQGEMGEEGTRPGETPSFDTLFEPTPEVSAEGGPPQMLDEDGLPMAGIESAGHPGSVYASQVMVPGEPTMGLPSAGVPSERPLRVARLTQIGSDSTCLIALVRWIEFLLTRVRRDQIKSLLSFYVRIGWISDGIRNHIIDVIRGIRAAPGGAKVSAGGMEAPKDKEGDVVMAYGKERVHEMKAMDVGKRPVLDDWRMTIEDHLKSLIFIERVRGTEVNKDRLEDLERDVDNLRQGLEGFFGL